MNRRFALSLRSDGAPSTVVPAFAAGSLFGALHMIVFWALVIGAIWLAIRMFSRGTNDSPPRSSALDILDERYARGEIDKAEYDRLRSDLLR